MSPVWHNDPPSLLDFGKKLFSSLLHLPRDTAGIRICCCPAICLLFPAAPAGDGGRTQKRFGEVKGGVFALIDGIGGKEALSSNLIGAAICKQNLLNSHKSEGVSSEVYFCRLLPEERHCPYIYMLTRSLAALQTLRPCNPRYCDWIVY